MKQLIITIGTILLTSFLYSQGGVGINNNGSAPNTSAMLDVASTDKGLLIPRVSLTSTTDATTITNGNVTSLLVYNTVTIADVVPGYYYWDGTVWKIIGGNDADADPTNEIQDLQLVGNNLTITNNGTPTTIDLSSYLDNTDDQNIDSVILNGNNLTVYIEDGTSSAVDLSSLITPAYNHDEWKDSDSIGMNNFIYANQAINGGDTVVITDNGYLGMGMSSPLFPIDVQNGNGPIRVQAFQHVGNAATLTYPQFQESGLLHYYANNNNWAGTGATSGGQVWNTGRGFYFWPYSDETLPGGNTINDTALFMVQGQSGNVGVGTRYPNQKLHVIGNEEIHGSELIYGDANNNFSSFTVYRKNRNGNAVQPGDELGQILSASYDGSNYGYSTRIMMYSGPGTVSPTSKPGTLAFGTVNDGSTTVQDRMTILPNGNVGIDIGTPANKLQVGSVGGTGYSGNQIAIGNGTNAMAINSNAGRTLFTSNTSFDFVGAGDFLIYGNDVGIGTTTPTNKLDINGDLRVQTIAQGTGADVALVADANGVVKQVAPYVPPGAVIPFAMATAPAGWLICDGSAVSRTTYADLFASIGTTYGTGNNTTTFNLPDLRGEFIRGSDNGRGLDAGRAHGSVQSGTLVGADVDGVSTTNGLGLYTINPSSGFDLLGADPTNAINLATYQTNNVGFLNLGPQAGGTYASRPDLFGISRPRNIAMNYCIRF